MIAIVAGATGLTGQELIRQLEHDSRITAIRALVRSSGRLAPSPKLQEILLPQSGFDGMENSTDPALSGDLYFCALGTTIKKAGSQDAFRKVDHDAVVSFARLCSTRQGRAFALVSATGANPQSKIFYSRVKGDAEKEVLSFSIPRIVIARPSLLIGDRSEHRSAERAGILFYRAISPLLPQPIRSRLGTDVPQLISRLIQESVNKTAGQTILEASEI
jgi:uncharacterized protein YbjT (DUF2867 family)